MDTIIQKLTHIKSCKQHIRESLIRKGVMVTDDIATWPEAIDNLSLGLHAVEGVATTASTTSFVLSSDVFRGNFILVIELDSEATRPSNFLNGIILSRLADTTSMIMVESRNGTIANVMDSRYNISEDTVSISRRTLSYSWVVGENYNFKIIEL